MGVKYGMHMTARTEWINWRTAVAVMLLVVLAFLAFGGALQCGFVHFDDDLYVFNNSHVRSGLSWEGVSWAFTTGHAGNWHPLTWLSLMADTEWCGGEAWGYHATSLVLHALNGALLFLVLRRWTGRHALALAAAALWVVHPLRTESVVWISERKDVLAMFFGLLALGAYGSGSVRGRMGWVALWFALSLLAKPMWVTLPFVLLLVDAWPLGRWPATSAWRLAMEKWPLFLLSGVSSAVTYLVQHAGGAVQSFVHLPFGTRLVNAIVAVVWYMRKWVWPVELAVNYPYPVQGHSTGAIFGSIAVLLLLTLWAIWVWRRGWKSWGMGWLWFLGTLVPMIGLVQVGVQAWADRYSYLPHIGLMVALVWGVGEALDRRVGTPRRGVRPQQATILSARGSYLPTSLVAVVVALILGLSLASRRQTAVWRDSETLFGHILAHTENNARAHGILGYVYALEGRNEEAVWHLTRTLAIQPDNLRALNNLAWVWAMAPDASPEQMEAGYHLARKAAAQIWKAKAEGIVLEAGVESAVFDTLKKVEERVKSMNNGETREEQDWL